MSNIPTPAQIPLCGLGTFGLTGDVGIAAILSAMEIGYRHLDTAQSYGTEASVAAALRRSGLPRHEFFITTKVADTNLDKVHFLPSVERSLETLGLDQIDLLLIHWPSKDDQVPFEHYMLALAEAQSRGWVRLIGVSNFPVALLERARVLLGDAALATNQVELHPYLQAPVLRDYALQRGLRLIAYQPLNKGVVNQDPVLTEIGQAHGVSGAAVSLAFLMAEGHAVIPGSVKTSHLRANFAASTVQLSVTELSRIRTLNRGQRSINPDKSPRWDD
jgi:2,5-diketo-D-gluconate reductase B